MPSTCSLSCVHPPSHTTCSLSCAHPPSHTYLSAGETNWRKFSSLTRLIMSECCLSNIFTVSERLFVQWCGYSVCFRVRTWYMNSLILGRIVCTVFPIYAYIQTGRHTLFAPKTPTSLFACACFQDANKVEKWLTKFYDRHNRSAAA